MKESDESGSPKSYYFKVYFLVMCSTLLNIEMRDYNLLDNSKGDALVTNPQRLITSAQQDVSTSSISQLWFLCLSLFAIS